MKSFKIFILTALLFLLPVAAFALRIDNPKVRMQVTSGKSYSGAIVVDNPTKEDVTVKVYLEDFIYVDPFNGDKKFMARGTIPRTISDFITFSPTSFTLAPFNSKTVSFSITPDKKITETHCGVLFFETSIGTSMEEGKAIDVMGRLGSLIFLDPEDAKKSAAFTVSGGGDYTITGTLANAGNAFFSALGTFYVMDDKGMVADRGQTEGLYLMPGDKHSVDIKFSKSLPPGKYTAVISFDLEGGEIFTKEIDFSLASGGTVQVGESRD
jgi:hypothetical protein